MSHQQTLEEKEEKEEEEEEEEDEKEDVNGSSVCTVAAHVYSQYYSAMLVETATTQNFFETLTHHQLMKECSQWGAQTHEMR